MQHTPELLQNRGRWWMNSSSYWRPVQTSVMRVCHLSQVTDDDWLIDVQKGNLYSATSVGQIIATVTRTAMMRARMDTSKTARTPTRFPRLRRTGRITRRARLKDTPLLTVTLSAGTVKAVLGLKKATQTHDRAPSPSSPVPPVLEKTSRARTWSSRKRTTAGP